MAELSGASEAPSEEPEVVELTVPADPAYLAIMRRATDGLATHLDLTVDEIQDLRIAVDEACSLLISGDPADDRELTTSFTLERSSLTVRIDGPAPVLPGRDDYAWTVLHALTSDVSTGQGGDGSWIRLTHHRREVVL